MTIYVGPENFEDLTPTASQRIGGGFGQGLSEGLQMLVQQKLKGIQQQKQNEALAALGLPANLPPELQKEYIKEKIKSQESEQKLEREKLEKSEIASKEKEDLTDIVNNLSKLAPKVGPGKILNRLTSEGREARGEFDTLALGLENIAKEMVGKGTMSQARFKYLTERLPSSSNTESKNRGILKAWKKILHLSEKDFEKKYKSEIEKESAEEKILSKDLATKFLKMAKGNKDKARELARKNGYSF